MATQLRPKPHKKLPEPDLGAVAACHEAEQGICTLLFLGTDEDRAKIFSTLQPKDFYYGETGFAFDEARRMRAAGVPLADKAGWTSWYAQPDVVERFKALGLGDWQDSSGKPSPSLCMLACFVEGQFASGAHLDYYIQQVRMWRVARGIRTVALGALEIINRDSFEALKALAKLETEAAMLRALASSVNIPDGSLWSPVKTAVDPD